VQKKLDEKRELEKKLEDRKRLVANKAREDRKQFSKLGLLRSMLRPEQQHQPDATPSNDAQAKESRNERAFELAREKLKQHDSRLDRNNNQNKARVLSNPKTGGKSDQPGNPVQKSKIVAPVSFVNLMQQAAKNKVVPAYFDPSNKKLPSSSSDEDSETDASAEWADGNFKVYKYVTINFSCEPTTRPTDRPKIIPPPAKKLNPNVSKQSASKGKAPPPKNDLKKKISPPGLANHKSDQNKGKLNHNPTSNKVKKPEIKPTPTQTAKPQPKNGLTTIPSTKSDKTKPTIQKPSASSEEKDKLKPKPTVALKKPAKHVYQPKPIGSSFAAMKERVLQQQQKVVGGKSQLKRPGTPPTVVPSKKKFASAASSQNYVARSLPSTSGQTFAKKSDQMLTMIQRREMLFKQVRSWNGS